MGGTEEEEEEEDEEEDEEPLRSGTGICTRHCTPNRLGRPAIAYNQQKEGRQAGKSFSSPP